MYGNNLDYLFGSDVRLEDAKCASQTVMIVMMPIRNVK